jgi:AraC family transcriptional regulator
MEWLKRLNKAVDYIENNLCGTVNIDEAARIACCSAYHFQRMFSYISEVPLAEYIRRRRMTAAAFEIQSTNAKIIDIALKYGYESPTSFNRAFQSIHGISPVNARSEGIVLTAYPRMSLSVVIKGNSAINYRIEKKEAFRIIGIKKNLKTDIEKNFKSVPLFWKNTKKSPIFPKLCKLITSDFPKILGVTVYENKDNFYYYIAVKSNETLPGTLEYTVPASSWVVFECNGSAPDSLQKQYRQFYTEWLPTSGYNYEFSLEIEAYPDGNPNSETYKSELWFPIKK